MREYQLIMTKFFLLLLVCLGSIGCAVEAPDTNVRETAIIQADGTWRICLDVSDDIREGAEAAVAGWAATLAPWRPMVLADERCGAVVVEVEPADELCSPTAFGCVNSVGALLRGEAAAIYLQRDNFDPEDTPNALMHELGHLLGLEHRDDHTDLMAPVWAAKRLPVPFECPNEKSVRALETKAALEPGTLLFCPVPEVELP